ncbi:MAG: hypothetical protein COT45_06450 [bacterium (Candidatus Stahlbacteria) CG08_land_8_20_14_0_20_40_26]|nr:MAG: hypothetical protein COT45_06450 [bacterium (Candidatus Stahlbacteria) CG08_land_8_20_14_0_20_40_26]
MKMKCPFLEEVLVRYCKAYPIKKLIPCGTSDTISLCLSNDYVKCSEYRSVAKIDEQQSKEVSKMKMAREEDIKAMKELPGKERQCIWAKLGVISYRLCTLNYNCDKCQFNQSLMDANGKYTEAPEMFNIINRLRNLPASDRKCRYMLMGEVSYKLCPNNYQCGSCEYDQRMQDAICGHPKVLARMAKVKQLKVNGFLILSHLYFYKKHTWVRRMSQDTVRVGLDDFAQRLLGKIEGIDFLREEKVRKGEIGWEVKTRLGYAQLLSPIDGIVKKINEELSKDSSLLNTDSYGKGWVLELEPFNIEESLRNLLKGDTAKDWLEEEIDRLHTRVEKELGVTIADGGELVQAINERISDEEWRKLVKEFLL